MEQKTEYNKEEYEKAKEIYEKLLKEYPKEKRIIEQRWKETPTLKAMELLEATATMYF